MLVRPPDDSLLERTPARRLAPAAILALTDDPEVRDLLFELALQEGWGVCCADTQAEAEALLEAERPGLVVADLDMPSRGGARFLGALRRNVDRQIPCVVLTASNDMMLAVSVDAPVFFKPELEGLPEALSRLFSTTD